MTSSVIPTTIVGRYGESVDFISRGTAGRIYKTNTGFAVKVLPFKYISEISLVRSLQHPNIIQFHDVEIDGVNIKIYMPLYDCNLFTFARPRNFFPQSPMFKNIVWQMVQAVGYLASRGVIHRDIKPPNFLVKTEGFTVSVVLADFDFAAAKSYLNTTRTNQIYTVSYRAPEIHLGSRCPSHKSDIWALALSIIDVLMAKVNIRDSLRVATLDFTLIPWIATNIGVPEKSCFLYEKFERELSKDDKFDSLINKIDCPKLRDMLNSMLQIDPDKRCNISDLYDHEFFSGLSLVDETIRERYDNIDVFRRSFEFDPHLETEISVNKAMQYFVNIAINAGTQAHLIHTTLSYFTRYVQKAKIENFYVAIQSCHYLACSFAILEGKIRFPLSPIPDIHLLASRIAKVLHDDFSASTNYDEILRHSDLSSPVFNLAVRLLTLAGQFYFLYTREYLPKICIYMAEKYFRDMGFNFGEPKVQPSEIDHESIQYYLNKIGFGIVDINNYMGQGIWDTIYTTN